MQSKKSNSHKIGFFGLLSGLIGYVVILYLSESFGFFLVYVGFIMSFCSVAMVWFNILTKQKPDNT